MYVYIQVIFKYICHDLVAVLAVSGISVFHAQTIYTLDFK